ncbi:sam domain containing protein [Stylonychia lemnae]|uniref:Sam domain containing protein n=1 Tax=Stylonychia lemnae TaxID=5949 RepID=A0A078A437_STYLE|nr:sam domain containing protein [Stylonychia lemnae]|eukprot:CDW76639.1 sam domain containing protein [Stylonychia lemnae]
MLEEETKKMEEKLELVKKMMELEKEKRTQVKKNKEGTVWRSATTQKQISGYSQMVVQQHRTNQPNLPPTTMIMGKENFQSSKGLNGSRLGSGQSQRVSGGTGNQMTVNANTNNTAADNLNKAINKQNPTQSNAGQYPEIESFLNEVQLPKYKDQFIENGIEDLEIILELDEKHLEQMNIPLGHKLKIMKRIKDLRKDRGMSVPESRQGQRQKVDGGIQANPADNVHKEVRPHQRQDLEALPEPDYSNLHTQKQGSTNTASNGSSLLNGNYNEQESHKQFLEALNAWRSAGPTNQSKPDKTVDGAQQEKEIKPDLSIRTSSAQQAVRKESCWNCYKLFPAEQSLMDQATKRHFCSQGCYDKNMQANQIPCQYEECSKRFVKVVGTFVHGKWFCSEACAELDPETQRLRDMLENGIEFNNDKVEGEDDGEDYADDNDIDL